MCSHGDKVPQKATERTVAHTQDWPRTAATHAGSVLLQTARRDAENRTSFLFTDPEQVLAANDPDQIPAVFEAVEAALAEGCHVAGFVSYEAGYHFEPAALRGNLPAVVCDLPLVWFGVYRQRLACEEDTARSGSDSLPGEAGVSLQELTIGISRDDYTEAIDKIRRYIAAGDVYQANFTIAMRQAWHGDAGRLFERMMQNQPVAYGALIHSGEAQILSASPELFFRRRGSEILVRPMKGTAPRGRDRREDARHAAWLAADAKNRAENVMIVDLLRNDLGRICRAGSVAVTDLFAVERYPDLLQMTSTIRGTLLPGASYYGMFRSLFPCGSITGAPKVRTMQVIRELEGAPRGIACGAIGYFSPQGDACFSVAIRTATLRNGELRLRVGSGVTYDSDAASEFAECALKAQFLTRAPRRFELIETLLWEGGYFLLDLHLERMADSAAYFDFRCDEAAIREQLRQFAAGLPAAGRQRVRMLLARNGAITLSSQAIAKTPPSVTLTLAGEQVSSRDPFLRHKTTQRAVYDRALSDAQARGCDDALFVNERGEVTEGAIHNVLVRKDGRWVTPHADCGVLPGVYRRYLLERHPEIRQGVVTLDDLRAAERVYVFNSVRGLRRVTQIV